MILTENQEVIVGNILFITVDGRFNMKSRYEVLEVDDKADSIELESLNEYCITSIGKKVTMDRKKLYAYNVIVKSKDEVMSEAIMYRTKMGKSHTFILGMMQELANVSLDEAQDFYKKTQEVFTYLEIRAYADKTDIASRMDVSGKNESQIDKIVQGAEINMNPKFYIVEINYNNEMPII